MEDEAPVADIQLDADEQEQAALVLELEEFDERAPATVIEELSDSLRTSGMPFMLLNAGRPHETTLLTSDEYCKSVISPVFTMIVDALYRSWKAGATDKRRLVAALALVRWEWGHVLRPKEGGRKGTLSPALAKQCQEYVASAEDTILICLDAPDAATIHCWCSAQATRFEWHFVQALCKSFWHLSMTDRQTLNRQGILNQLTGPQHKSLAVSVFNELDSL